MQEPLNTAEGAAGGEPAPGTASSPGPVKVPAGELRKLLGVTTVNFVQGRKPLAIVDTPLIA